MTLLTPQAAVANAMVGGDNASRSIAVGMVLGAAEGTEVQAKRQDPSWFRLGLGLGLVLANRQDPYRFRLGLALTTATRSHTAKGLRLGLGFGFGQ